MKPSPHPRGETGQWHSSGERPEESGADLGRAHCQASLLQMGLITLQITPRLGSVSEEAERGKI